MTETNDPATPRPEAIHDELNLLEKELSISNDRQLGLRKFSIGLSFGIVFLFLLYIGAFAKHIHDNFSEQAFRKGIESHMGDMTNLATDLSLDVVKQIGPTYLKQIDKKSKTFVPKLIVNFEQESAALVTSLSKFAQDEYDKRLNRILLSQEKAFKKAYPEITDEELAQFLKDTEKDIEELLTVVSKEIVDNASPAIGEMKAIAEYLTDGKEFPDEDFELIRLFLHNLLMIMDKEIMEG